MEEKKNVENRVLQELRCSGAVTRMFLTNGFQLRCRILDFDDRVIIIHEEKVNKDQMLYRHAVSTIEIEGGQYG